MLATFHFYAPRNFTNQGVATAQDVAPARRARQALHAGEGADTPRWGAAAELAELRHSLAAVRARCPLPRSFALSRGEGGVSAGGVRATTLIA